MAGWKWRTQDVPSENCLWMEMTLHETHCAQSRAHCTCKWQRGRGCNKPTFLLEILGLGGVLLIQFWGFASFVQRGNFEA